MKSPGTTRLPFCLARLTSVVLSGWVISIRLTNNRPKLVSAVRASILARIWLACSSHWTTGPGIGAKGLVTSRVRSLTSGGAFSAVSSRVVVYTPLLSMFFRWLSKVNSRLPVMSGAIVAGLTVTMIRSEATDWPSWFTSRSILP